MLEWGKFELGGVRVNMHTFMGEDRTCSVGHYLGLCTGAMNIFVGCPLAVSTLILRIVAALKVSAVYAEYTQCKQHKYRGMMHAATGKYLCTALGRV